MSNSSLAFNQKPAPLTKILARGSYARRFIVLGLLVWIADFLFYDQNVGLSICLFTVSVAGAAAFAQAERPAPGHAIRAALILLTAVLPLVFGAGFISVSFAILGLAYSVVALGSLVMFSWSHVMDALRLLLRAGWRIFPDVIAAERAFAAAWQPGPAISLLLIWVVPLGLGAVFLILFANANPLIEDVIGALDPLNLLYDFSMLRLSFWLAAACMVWPFVAALPRREHKPHVGVPRVLPLGRALLGKAAVLRALVLFNLMFAVQTVLDVYYLWCGRKLPDGLSYADYAHRGAYPLIVTALLAGAFAIIAAKPGSPAAASRLIRMLVLLWIGQNVLLVMSSILRLHLYVEAYSLTELRLAAFIWMLLVAFGLLTIVARILLGYSDLTLIRANAAALACVLYLCALLNIDGFVADYDVHHCREVTGTGAPLDLTYFDDLGPAAIPALDRYEVLTIPRSAGNGIFQQSGPAGQVRADLLSDFSYDPHDWRGWDFWSWALHCYLATHPVRYTP